MDDDDVQGLGELKRNRLLDLCIDVSFLVSCSILIVLITIIIGRCLQVRRMERNSAHPEARGVPAVNAPAYE